ncbi:hypothetical protein BD324DRAFT_633237 [Kockovaella imperatae]|uniref:Uncharacterized protein n=1 Tax=Kockovaella imperatae TaxID=4999 RepID=A0A1Y1UCX9_9TREE|nr:hypothetical protein BD324DRAFT_633237 [Kockovaella imperatae]ORX34925.1 hypothetical protein BD324DRAFT_633237 [Kockovaella imperatae]
MLAAVTMPQTTEAEKRARKIEMDTSSKSFLSALDKLESLAVNLQSQESRKSIAATRNLFEAADQPEPWKALFEYSQHRSAMLEKEGEDERSSQALLCDALLARILELESAGPSYHLAMFWAQTGTAVLTALSLVGEGVSNIALCARDIGRAAQSTTPGFSGWSNSQGVEPGTTVQDNTTETVTNDGQVFEDDKPVSIANSKVEPNTTGITARSPYSSEKREALDG